MKQIAALIVLMLVGCASGSKTSAVPADLLSEKDLAELCSKLDEQAARRAGFTATYRVQGDEPERTLRFTYLAPDRARLDGIDGTSKSIAWVIGDRCTIHSDEERQSCYGTMRFTPLAEQWTEFAAALHAAFPPTAISRDHQVELGPGPVFDLRVEPDPGSFEHGSLESSLAWLELRDWFLPWLCRARTWKNVQLEGSHLRGDDGNGIHLSISTESGILEEVGLGEHVHVKLVEFLDHTDESDFVIPDPKPGATDESARLAMIGAAAWFQTERNNAVRRIEAAARSETPDAPVFRERVTRLFDLLHRTYARTRFVPVLESLKTWIDNVSRWSTATNHLASKDSAARETAERKIATYRSDLEASLEEWATTATDGVTAMEPAEGDPAQLASIAKSENERIAQSVRSEFVEPLLRRFDDSVKLAREQR